MNHAHTFEIQSGYLDDSLPDTESRIWHPSTNELPNRLPEHAILSHRWFGEEITFTEFEYHAKTQFCDVAPKNPVPRYAQYGDKVDLQGNASSMYKIAGACRQVRRDGKVGESSSPRHIWIDTVCINKADTTELSTAINSMFR
ncbi:hypothetical protein JX266_008730 [Neoarthrinium moseri]|nr:hypothetical protein JX266_008730 [Neoarthrinium moseri]